MFFDGAFSEAGKVSEEKLNVFRSQLEPGSDPAFDYSQHVTPSSPPSPPAKPARQARASADRPKLRVDLAAAQDTSPTGLEQLRKTLRGILDRAEAVEAGAAAGLVEGHGGDPVIVIKARPSRAFLAPSREDRSKLDVGARFEELCPVPPVGHYQPQEGLCHPRVVCLSDYGRRLVARSPRRLSPTNSCSLNSLTASVSSGELHFLSQPQSPSVGLSKYDLTVARNFPVLSDTSRSEMPMTGLVKKVPQQRNRCGLRAASVGSLGTASIASAVSNRKKEGEDGLRSRSRGYALTPTASSTLEPMPA